MAKRNQNGSYLSFWHDPHRQPVNFSPVDFSFWLFDDLLTQMQHFRQTPRLQSMHSRRRLNRRENPSPHRAQTRWLRDFCFANSASNSRLFWAEVKSDSTCLECKIIKYVLILQIWFKLQTVCLGTLYERGYLLKILLNFQARNERSQLFMSNT